MKARVIPSSAAALLCLLCAYASSAGAAPSSALAVTVQTFAPSPDGSYVEVDGALSGMLHRDDGSVGTYEVPVWLSYPADFADCNGTGIVDVVNSVLYETFPEAGTASAFGRASLWGFQRTAHGAGVATPDNDLFAFAGLLLGHDRFLRDDVYGGYVYGEVQWNKMVIDRQLAAGTSPSPSYHIERATDGYAILRDMSGVLRDLGRYFRVRQPHPTPPRPCPSEDIIAFGHSQTGQLLRAFYFDRRNSAMGASPMFDDGLVFEGAVHSAGGGSCRRLEDGPPLYAYDACSGATPASEGLVLSINTETDVQILHAWRARTSNAPGEESYYRAYEIAGTSHIPDASPTPVQNHVDYSAVYRSLVDKLKRWIDDAASPPPPPAWLDGSPLAVAAPLFSPLSWGNHEALVFTPNLGPDSNARGGIRLVHVDSTPNGWPQRIGAPLGVYRGADCFVDSLQPSYLSACSGLADPFIYAVNGGTFTPYTELAPGPGYCTQVGGLDGIREAAERGAYAALAAGYILSMDVQPMVDRQVALAQQLLGCI